MCSVFNRVLSSYIDTAAALCDTAFTKCPGKHNCKLNIGQELSSGMKRYKTAVIPADDYLPGTHNVEEVIGKLTFDTQMFIEKGKGVQRSMDK
jgi:hypothetical protein